MVSPSEHQLGGTNFAMEMRVLASDGIQKLQFILLFEEVNIDSYEENASLSTLGLGSGVLGHLAGRVAKENRLETDENFSLLDLIHDDKFLLYNG